MVLSRDEPQGQPMTLVEAVLRADPAKLPTFVGVDLGVDGYAVARVDKVLPAQTPSAEQAAQSQARYGQLWGLAEARSYYGLLKARYKAQILTPAPAAAAAPIAQTVAVVPPATASTTAARTSTTRWRRCAGLREGARGRPRPASGRGRE